MANHSLATLSYSINQDTLESLHFKIAHMLAVLHLFVPWAGDTVPGNVNHCDAEAMHNIIFLLMDMAEDVKKALPEV